MVEVVDLLVIITVVQMGAWVAVAADNLPPVGQLMYTARPTPAVAAAVAVAKQGPGNLARVVQELLLLNIQIHMQMPR